MVLHCRVQERMKRETDLCEDTERIFPAATKRVVQKYADKIKKNPVNWQVIDDDMVKRL